LLFDEPTNDLDLPTLGALEELLCAFDGSVIVVTHDRAFLDQVATGILAFEGEPDGGAVAQVTRYAGGYEDYVAQRGARRPQPARPAAAAAPVAASVAAVAPPTPRDMNAKDSAAPPPKAKTKGGSLTYAERLELETIVDRIEAAEAQVTEVERLLADPSLYARRGDEVVALQARLAAARQEAASLAARWEALEAKKNG
jgi:ATP-binding cassette subfamily F protein uup